MQRGPYAAGNPDTEGRVYINRIRPRVLLHVPTVPCFFLAQYLSSLPVPCRIMACSSTVKSSPASPKSSSHSRINSTPKHDWVPDPEFYYELHTFQVRYQPLLRVYA